jgi:prevent-host-death family protein
LTNLTNSTNLLRRITLPEHTVAKSVNIYDAKTRLSELVDRASAGEEIVIAKAGRPAARLVPLRVVREARAPGRWRGKLRIAADFDAPLSAEAIASFEGRDE